jgi:hypothetical protein
MIDRKGFSNHSNLMDSKFCEICDLSKEANGLGLGVWKGVFSLKDPLFKEDMNSFISD